MDKAQLVEEMAKHFYDEYREKCKNLTDRELQDINYKNTRIVASTPVNTDNFQTIGRCYAEGMVCKEILEGRKKYSDAIKNWRNNLNKRKEEAILSLPVATSELGQLIAAILEFKGELKLKEICACVNEYNDIEDSKIIECINGLVKEEIIFKTDDKYHILNICTASLFPENIFEFAEIAFKRKNVKFEEKHIDVLKILNDKKTPLSEDDIREKSKFNKYRVEEALLDLENNGVLESILFDDIGYMYYLKMLGERSN